MISILIFIFLLGDEAAMSQRKELDSLSGLILKYQDNSDYYFEFCAISQDIEEIEKTAFQGLIISQNINNQLAEYRFFLLIANQYNARNMHGKALVFYQKALSLNNKLGNSQNNAALIFMQMGSIYLTWKDLLIAKEYFQNACTVYESLNDSSQSATCYNLLGKIYFDLQKLNRSEQYFQKSLDMSEDSKEIELTIKNLTGLGETEFANARFESALEYFEEALHKGRKIENDRITASIKINMAEIYIVWENFAKAIVLLNDANKTALSKSFPELEMKCFKLLSEVNTELGNDYQALEQYSGFIELRDSFYNSGQHDKLAELRAKYEFLQKEKKLKKHNKEIEILQQQEKITKTKVYFLTGSLLLLIAIGVLITKKLRSRYKSGKEMIEKSEFVHNSQKSLMRASMMNTRLEKQHLSDEIDNKNSELSRFMLNKVRHIDFIKDLISAAKNIIQLPEKQQLNEIYKLIKTIDNNLKQDKDVAEFYKYVEHVNKEFVSKLELKFPSLSSNEKKLSVFLRLGLSTKEMVYLTNSSVKAVEMARYRLRKKLELQNSEKLYEFFQKI